MKNRPSITNNNPNQNPLLEQMSLADERAASNLLIQGVEYMKSAKFVESKGIKSDLTSYVSKSKDPLRSYMYIFNITVLGAENDTSHPNWTIRKTYADFVALSKDLSKELVKQHRLPDVELPQLPAFNEHRHVEGSKFPLRDLATYLSTLVENKQIREISQVLYEFLEMSLLQLPPGTKKFKEGYLKKRSGGRYKEGKCQIYCSVFFRRWVERWCIITNEGIIYIINSQSSRVRESLLFDQSFKIEYGRRATGTKKGITLSTSTRKLHLRAANVFQAIEWIYMIQEAVKQCPYVQINRYLSFAPLRPATAQCDWFVDAEGYFSTVCDALLAAKKEVYITGWWVSPELYLKRPVPDHDTTYRLDKVLERIAQKGVKIHIIVWREVKMVGLYNDSDYTKKVLQGLSPNIKVIRHGSRFPYLWSHHEKIVVIDQTIGFLGGLDLCYGRMDLRSHPLNDPAFDSGEGETFPGIDFSNARSSDFTNVREYNNCAQDKFISPRMPWHDIHMKVIGEPVRDLTRHFIQYWNYAEIDLRFRKDHFLTAENETKVTPETNCHDTPTGDCANSSTSSKLSVLIKEKLGSLISNTRNRIRHPKNPNSSKTMYYQKFENDFDMTQSVTRSQDQFDKYVESKIHWANSFDPSKNSPSRKNKTNDRKISMKNLLMDDDDEEEKKEEPLIPSRENPFRKSDRQQAGQDDLRVPRLSINQNPRQKEISALKESTRGRSLSGSSKTLPILPELSREESYEEGPRRRSRSISSNAEVKFEKQYVDLLRNIRQKEINCLKQDTYIEPEEEVKKKRSFISLLRTSGPKRNLDDEDQLQLSYIKSASKLGTCACQVLRSASNWSLGLNTSKKNGVSGFENSIQNAYIELIQNAKHFIYIENQFFMSSTAGDPVTNEIASALLLRIKKAYDNKQKFKVIVFLPLLPGFEGEVDDPKSTVLRIQLYWQYQTISRGGASIFETLDKYGIPNPEDYIQFMSLRQHGKMGAGPVTEMIYIHSKLMIVDDNIAIMGSANINDRSMQGSRDSEIAMIVEDSKKVSIKMNGVQTEVGVFAHTLRKELYKEHLGMYDAEVEDPLNENLTRELTRIAERNTEIYRTVFACYPDDNIRTLPEVKEFKSRAKPDQYDTLKHQIKGNIVRFPLHFLSETNLFFAKTDKEMIVPSINFT